MQNLGADRVYYGELENSQHKACNVYYTCSVKNRFVRISG